MTTLLEKAPAPPTPKAVPKRRVLRVTFSALPWLITAGLLVAGLLSTGTPPHDVAVYASYLAFAVVLPGTLVHRALRGSRGNLPEDLGLGAATGFVVMLMGWALAAATSRQSLLPGWPLLVVVLFLAVPGLRRHWRVGERRPLPVTWSWIVAAAVALAGLSAYAGWRLMPLPPITGIYYQDLYYHLSLVHEMTRSMPFQVPQLAGDVLRYHYLSDADMAVATMITRIPPTTVLLRLWLVPVAAATIVVFAALGRQVSGKWWAGALAGVASVAVLPLSLGVAAGVMGGAPINLLSPSQTFALPLMGLLVTIVVDVLRGRPLRWAWAMVFPVALACAGAKSSSLPPLMAGLLLAVLVVLIRHRRRLWRTLLLCGMVLGALLLGLRIFAGGGAGTAGLQPLAILYWFTPYRETLGVYDVIDGTLKLPYGVQYATVAGRYFLVWILAWWALMQAPRLLGLAMLGTRRGRSDPASWLLAGMIVSGAGATFLLWHPATSQLYFFLGSIPFGCVLTVWLLADRARSPRPVLTGLAAGVITAVIWHETDKAPPRPAPTIGAWSWAMASPLVLTAGIATAVGLLSLVAWRLATGRMAWRALPAGLAAAVLGAGLVPYTTNAWRDSHRELEVPLPASELATLVSQDEMTAALWLDKNARPDDVVATNVHCLQIAWQVCDARAFWISGLAGRRTLIEGWAYSDQSVASDGVNGLRYTVQPPPYPDRYELNQRVFATGDPADVAELRRLYHVRWLFGDSRAAGGVSAALAKVAQPRLVSGPVTIYDLDRAP